jgi:hypothetical protein
MGTAGVGHEQDAHDGGSWERAVSGVIPLWVAVGAFELIALVSTLALFHLCRGPATGSSRRGTGTLARGPVSRLPGRGGHRRVGPGSGG